MVLMAVGFTVAAAFLPAASEKDSPQGRESENDISDN